MITWPDSHGMTIEAYLEVFHLRRPSTRATYRDVLRNFERFVKEYSPTQPPSLKSVEAWLHQKIKRLPLSSVIPRACIVNGFLDWLVANHVLPDNPLDHLRQTYGQRATAPIVRSLLSPSPKVALESLPILPRFASHLGAVMWEHISRMRALGFRYESVERLLLAFDRYLQTRPGAATEPLAQLTREYAALASTPTLKIQRLKLGRLLTKSLHRTDPSVVLIPLDRHLIQEAARLKRKPYIFSPTEIQQLLATAHHYPSPFVPLRPHTLHTMVILAYCAGLRRSELAHLKMEDLDLEESSICIRQSKFFKSRRLPLTDSVIAVLKSYLDTRQRAGAPCHGEASLFWNERGARGYSPRAVSKLLTTVMRRSGLKPASGREGPSIHDLRRTFVVHRMTQWYSSGINPQTRLPHLATYLGHKDIRSSLIYLTITEDLLAKASQRFRSFGAKVLQTTGEATHANND
jgi:integrase/recombinase XerD